MKTTYTTREIVSILRANGSKVTFKERTDGGIKITSIDGRIFKGVEGNKFARSLTGHQLSSAQLGQRTTITYNRESKYDVLGESLKEKIIRLNDLSRKWNIPSPIKNRRQALNSFNLTGEKTTRNIIDSALQFVDVGDDIRHQYFKTKRAWEKNENLKGSRISVEKTLNKIKNEGIKAVKDQLKNLEIYAKGGANAKNIYVFKLRLEALGKKYHTKAFDKVIDWVNTHYIIDANMMDAYDLLYEIDKGTIPANEQSAKLIIKTLNRK